MSEPSPLLGAESGGVELRELNSADATVSAAEACSSAPRTLCEDDEHYTPPDFSCPITRMAMVDPVVCSDGHSYERASIVENFRRGNLISPLDRTPLARTVTGELLAWPNIALRGAFAEYRARKGLPPLVRASSPPLTPLMRWSILNAELASRQAVAAEERGDVEHAEALLRSALAARSEGLGAVEIHTLRAVSNLAHFLTRAGRSVEAEPLFRCAVEGHETALGITHRETLAMQSHLALLLYSVGGEANWLEAEDLCRRAIAHGTNDASSLRTATILASLLRRSERYSEAELISRRVVASRSATLGSMHRDTLIATNNLAQLLNHTGHTEEALSLYRVATVGLTEALGEDHADTINCQGNYGIALENTAMILSAIDALSQPAHACVPGAARWIEKFDAALHVIAARSSTSIDGNCSEEALPGDSPPRPPPQPSPATPPRPLLL